MSKAMLLLRVFSKPVQELERPRREEPATRRWLVLAFSSGWCGGRRLRGRNEEHPVPDGLDGCGCSQQDQGNPGGSFDQFDAGPRPRFLLGRVPASLDP